MQPIQLLHTFYSVGSYIFSVHFYKCAIPNEGESWFLKVLPNVFCFILILYKPVNAETEKKTLSNIKRIDANAVSKVVPLDVQERHCAKIEWLDRITEGLDDKDLYTREKERLMKASCFNALIVIHYFWHNTQVYFRLMRLTIITWLYEQEMQMKVLKFVRKVK